MSKVTKADFALTVPLKGVIGLQDELDKLTIQGFPSAGFSDKQAVVWSASQNKFIPANISGIAGYVAPTNGGGSSGGTTGGGGLPTRQQYYWDAPALKPLQSCYDDFPMVGALPGDPVSVGAPFDLQFCLVTACVNIANNIRLQITNMSLSTVDLPVGVWKLQIFNDAASA